MPYANELLNYTDGETEKLSTMDRAVEAEGKTVRVSGPSGSTGSWPGLVAMSPLHGQYPAKNLHGMLTGTQRAATLYLSCEFCYVFFFFHGKFPIRNLPSPARN